MSNLKTIIAAACFVVFLGCTGSGGDADHPQSFGLSFSAPAYYIATPGQLSVHGSITLSPGSKAIPPIVVVTVDTESRPGVNVQFPIGLRNSDHSGTVTFPITWTVTKLSNGQYPIGRVAVTGKYLADGQAYTAKTEVIVQ